MTSWAHVGVKCVCVSPPTICWDTAGKKHPLSRFGIHAPRENQILTIREVVQKESGTGLIFVEIDNRAIKTGGGKEVSFAIEKYRPLITKTQEEDVSMFLELLQKQEEPA